mgnify:CR=1 FL=1
MPSSPAYAIPANNNVSLFNSLSVFSISFIFSLVNLTSNHGDISIVFCGCGVSFSLIFSSKASANPPPCRISH